MSAIEIDIRPTQIKVQISAYTVSEATTTSGLSIFMTVCGERGRATATLEVLPGSTELETTYMQTAVSITPIDFLPGVSLTAQIEGARYDDVIPKVAALLMRLTGASEVAG